MTSAVPPSPRRRRLRFGRLALILLLLVLLGIGGTFGYYYLTSRTVRDATRIVLSGNYSPEKTFGRPAVNLLLMGRDVDLDDHAQVVKTRGRTDLLILAHLDFQRQTVDMLSIPRDTWVTVPGRGRHKINAAHALGGPELTMATVEELVGVRPDCYLTVDYQAVAQAIDGLGGVTVEVDKPLHYDDNWGNLHIHLERGVQRLNGEQTVGMARYRKSKTGEADTDLQRIERQHRILAALRSQMKDPAVLLRVPVVLDQVRARLETDLTPEHFASLAWFCHNLPAGTIHMATVPGTQRPTCIKPDLAACRAMAQEMFGP